MPVLWTADYEEHQGSRSIGWTESLVLSSANFTAATLELENPDGILTKRCRCFGSGVVNTENRLTLLPAAALLPIVPTRRAVTIVDGLTPAGATNSQQVFSRAPYYNPNNANFPADFGQSVYMVRFSTSVNNAPVYVRTFWMSGFPDAAQNIDSAILTQGGSRGDLLQFLSAVVRIGQIASQDRSNAFPFQQVASYNVGTNVYTLPAHGYVTGTRVDALNWRASPGAVVPRGQYRVTKITDDTFSLQRSAFLSGEYQLGGFRKVAVVYNNITSYTLRSFTNKKRGRPIGELRGRQSRQTSTRA